MGIECAVVLSRECEPELQGNLLTVVLMGARIQFVDTSDHWDLEQYAHALCEELTTSGHRPYYIPVSGTTPRSCLGYVRAGLELADQIRDRRLELDAVYLPFGTGGIFTATLFALRDRGIGCPLIGVSVNRDRAECLANIDRWWSALRSLLPSDTEPRREPIELYDEFVGKHYGDPTEASLDAIMLLARTEGILLDPVYSGKTAAALIAHQAAGRWGLRRQVLMLHSGGVPALFAYHKQIAAHLTRRAGASE
jgi:D-cysteine desulfhydrase